MIESVFLIIFLIILTFGSGFFSGSETALFSLSPMQIKAYKQDPDPKKRLIFTLLSKPKDLLVTVFMLNTLVNILLQNTASDFFGDNAGWSLKIGVPLFLTLVFGEIIPKNICMQNNVRVSYLTAPYVNFFHQLLGIVRKYTIMITHPISKLMFFYLRKEKSISQDELAHVLSTSEKYGVLHKDEANLVWGYLKLQDATVKEIMVPKEDILFYDIEEPITKLIHIFVDKECSRLPVCKKGLDNVLGIVSSTNFFMHCTSTSTGKDIKKIITKPQYIPENTPAKNLFRKSEETKEVLTLVVDEYGSVSGLVTKEDVVELVVGEITDKRDQKPLFTQSGKNEIIASGKLELLEFNRIFQADLKSPGNMVTIGGWLTEKLGMIPKGGTTFEKEGFLFQVLSADPNRIRRIYIRKGKK